MVEVCQWICCNKYAQYWVSKWYFITKNILEWNKKERYFKVKESRREVLTVATVATAPLLRMWVIEMKTYFHLFHNIKIAVMIVSFPREGNFPGLLKVIIGIWKVWGFLETIWFGEKLLFFNEFLVLSFSEQFWSRSIFDWIALSVILQSLNEEINLSLWGREQCNFILVYNDTFKLLQNIIFAWITFSSWI